MTSSDKSQRQSEALRQLRYVARPGYPHDIELLRFSTLRQMKSDAWFEAVERLSLYIVMTVDRGRCTHMAECQFFELQPRAVMVLKPGQVHRYDASQSWDGWLLLIRPEVLDPQAVLRGPLDISMAAMLDELPMQLQLPPPLGQRVDALMSEMAADATEQDGAISWAGLLLCLQLQTLCARLGRHQAKVTPHLVEVSSVDRARVAAFKAGLERDFHHAHHVGHYADMLQVTERSLSRSTQRVLGQTAKQVIVSRVLLEAKRLLVYSSEPAAQIGYTLGFDEATNFAKFFRRETGMNAQAFRTSVLKRCAWGSP